MNDSNRFSKNSFLNTLTQNDGERCPPQKRKYRTPAVRSGLEASREIFDMSSLFSRFKYFWQITSPSTLFASRNEIERASHVYFNPASYKNMPLQRRWECERLCCASLHPETKEYVLPPFRRSAFVAVNIPIYVGMLMSPQT